jgi:hypothetical protein
MNGKLFGALSIRTAGGSVIWLAVSIYSDPSSTLPRPHRLKGEP